MKDKTAPLRVLCVDDELVVRSMIADTLRAESYDVETALDGTHALLKLATVERPYDLLIVDGRMPHLDGWRFILEARTGGFKGKIIVFSAWLDAEERARYGKLDIDRMLDKPPRTGELVQAVKEIAAEVIAR